MSDLIQRQDAIDAVHYYIESGYKCDIFQELKNLPSAEPEGQEFEWCHDCKEYDQEKHCCHRWTKVIRNTVEEMKNQGQWIPVTEALPEEGRYLVTRYDYVTKSSFIDILWFEKNTWWNRQITGNFSVLAWMPLPEVWRSKE